MGEAAMIIDDEQLQKIGEYVKNHLNEWLPEEPFTRQRQRSSRELDLFERILVVETELKNLGVRMDERFDAMGKRFEALQKQMDERFDAMEKRFEAMDKRFEALQHQMDYRFEALQKQMDERFTAVDKRFSSMQWLMGIGFTVLALLMSVYQYL